MQSSNEPLTVYLDNHATTQVDPRVVAEMGECLATIFGNPSSGHGAGHAANEVVDKARNVIADAVGLSSGIVVYTSGATEANNLALLGVVGAVRSNQNHVVTCAIEHPSILETCKELERRGGEVTRLPVDSEGHIDLTALEDSLSDYTVLVSIIHGNHEIGTIQDMRAIGDICRRRGVLFHSDMTQSVGKIETKADEWGVDLVSLSAHKVYGPKGVGALVMHKEIARSRLQPQTFGGSQESGLRAGTLNVPGIVGFAKALEIAAGELENASSRCRTLRDDLLTQLCERVPDLCLNGPDPRITPERRLPNNLNIAFPDTESEAIMAFLGDVHVSTGSACNAASLKPSHVLSALPGRHWASTASIRMGVGRFTTVQEINYAADRIAGAVLKYRSHSG